MNEAQVSFLKTEFIPLLEKIPFDRKPVWGNMTVQQMIEHLSDVQQLASGKRANKILVVPQEKIPGSQKFLMSDKPFPQGVVNPLFPKDTKPIRNANIADALKELSSELSFYFSVLQSDTELIILQPYFGVLNKEMNLQAVYKHALHHLKQFGVVV
jgi:hypothetical protein